MAYLRIYTCDGCPIYGRYLVTELMHTSLHDHLDQLSPLRLSLAAGFQATQELEASIQAEQASLREAAKTQVAEMNSEHETAGQGSVTFLSTHRPK